MRRRRINRNTSTRRPLFPFLYKPAGQLAVVLFVAFIIYLIASAGGKSDTDPAREVSVDEAYQLYQSGAFVLDVSWPAEWEEYHAPGTTLVPLDQLFNRINELPRDREILVVSRSQTSSQQARDLLISEGIKAVNMAGSMSEWFAKGYPIEGAPPQ
ncbi:MAG TPA: rhodanese-like domain-containing protein [Anaerolineales bacterium]|nr:rhodanese-like domain-containing protein [Anaerolineales bacterium]